MLLGNSESQLLLGKLGVVTGILPKPSLNAEHFQAPEPCLGTRGAGYLDV